MESSADPQAFENAKSAAESESAANEGAAAPDASTSAHESHESSHESLDAPRSSSNALTRIEGLAGASADEDAAAKPEPQSTPIPSSALVILPPAKGGFNDDFGAGEPLGGISRKRTPWASNGVRAAAILLFAGSAYAVGNHYLSSPGVAVSGPAAQGTSVAAVTPPSAPAAAAVPAAATATPTAASPFTAAQNDALAELHHDNRVLNDEVRRLQTRLAAWQNQTPEEIRSLKKTIESLKADLQAQKSAAQTQIAQLSAKLDHLHDAAARAAAEKAHPQHMDGQAIQATLDRAARNETADTTGAIRQDAPHPNQVALASTEAPRRGPQLLNDWVVRDVYRGIALVQGPQGAVEVVPGDVLPGAGVVRAIQRRGDGWIVLTNRGYVDYSRN